MVGRGLLARQRTQRAAANLHAPKSGGTHLLLCAFALADPTTDASYPAAHSRSTDRLPRARPIASLIHAHAAASISAQHHIAHTDAISHYVRVSAPSLRPRAPPRGAKLSCAPAACPRRRPLPSPHRVCFTAAPRPERAPSAACEFSHMSAPIRTRSSAIPGIRLQVIALCAALY